MNFNNMSRIRCMVKIARFRPVAPPRMKALPYFHPIVDVGKFTKESKDSKLRAQSTFTGSIKFVTNVSQRRYYSTQDKSIESSKPPTERVTVVLPDKEHPDYEKSKDELDKLIQKSISSTPKEIVIVHQTSKTKTKRSVLSKVGDFATKTALIVLILAMTAPIMLPFYIWCLMGFFMIIACFDIAIDVLCSPFR